MCYVICVMSDKYNIQNTKYKILNTRDGFTLLETIITLFIITLMLALFLTGYREGSRNTDLNFAAQKLASDLRTAQNNSLGSVYYGGAIPAGGWGIHFDTSAPTAYLLFADQNNDKIYNAGEAVDASGGQTVVLPANVVIDTLNSGGGNRAQLDVTFLPPDPLARIYWLTNASSTAATITLRETTKGRIKTLNVNILGLIEAP
jgi:prepilin-type N-terminal cleavage/methylation domain-containing protein